MINFLKQIWSHRQFIIGGALILFIVLFIKQCDENSALKNQVQQSGQFAAQNIAALNDSTVQLRVTRKELAIVDSSLNMALIKIDSLEKIKSKIITVVVPKYINKEVIVPSELTYDSLQNNYGLTFNSHDSVRTIKGVSWFKIKNEEKTLSVLPQNTHITDFRLNFAFVVSQYVDDKTNYTRTKILPFYLKEDGELGDMISPDKLSISFRNAEILDKPNIPNTPTDIPPPVEKKWYSTGFGISLSPVALGLYPGLDGKYTVGWTPSIGLSYNITFNKK